MTIHFKKIFIISLLISSPSAFAWASTPPEKKTTGIIPAKTETPKTVAPKKQSSKRNVKIEAQIDRNDLRYDKFFSTYYPETFKIRVNGQELYSIKDKDVLLNKEVTIPVDGDKLVVEYEYVWDVITGKRVGTKSVEFDLNDKEEKLKLEFGSWKDDNHRILIPHASQVGEEKKIK